jgi:hypothetical protein
MHAIEIVALSMGAAWLAVLSIIVMVSLRQVGILTAWMMQRKVPAEGGLDIGAPIPIQSLDSMPELGHGLGYALFLSGNCVPCQDLASSLESSDEILGLRDKHPVFAVLRGKGNQVEDVARVLPEWVKIVRDPAASSIHEEFKITATPSIAEVDAGKLTGHAVAGQGIGNFENLVVARSEHGPESVDSLRGVNLEVTHSNSQQSGG